VYCLAYDVPLHVCVGGLGGKLSNVVGRQKRMTLTRIGWSTVSRRQVLFGRKGG